MSETVSTTASAETKENKNWLNLNTVLALLIALLSVLTGYAAFKSAEIDSTSTDNFFLAQTHLTDATLLFIEQGQEALYDHVAYNQYKVNQESNDEVAEYYFDQLSEAAKASIERPDGPFDKAYYEAIYSEAKTVLEKEEVAFDKALVDSDRAVAYQLTVLIMAVGLAFAGWGSLAEARNKLRFVFTGLSALALIVGLVQMLTIPGPPVP